MRWPAIGSSAWCCCGRAGKPTTRAVRRSTRSAAPASSPSRNSIPTAATTSCCAGSRSSGSIGEDHCAQLPRRAVEPLMEEPTAGGPRHHPRGAAAARSAAGAAAAGARRRSEGAAVDGRRGSRQRAGAVSRSRARGEAGAARARRAGGTLPLAHRSARDESHRRAADLEQRLALKRGSAAATRRYTGAMRMLTALVLGVVVFAADAAEAQARRRPPTRTAEAGAGAAADRAGEGHLSREPRHWRQDRRQYCFVHRRPRSAQGVMVTIPPHTGDADAPLRPAQPPHLLRRADARRPRIRAATRRSSAC